MQKEIKKAKIKKNFFFLKPRLCRGTNQPTGSKPLGDYLLSDKATMSVHA